VYNETAETSDDGFEDGFNDGFGEQSDPAMRDDPDDPRSF
jgi:hypothetical protein